MKKSIVLKGFVFALVAVMPAVGCKKKETKATDGSGSSMAGSSTAGPGSSMAGSGSAVADTGSGSAGSAAAGSGSAAGETTPWAADAAVIPANSKVTGVRDGNDQGTFDRALYFKVTDKDGSTNYELHLINGCEKLSCAHYVTKNGGVYESDKFTEECPNAKTMDIKIDGDADPKVGPVNLDVSINGPSSGGGLSGDPMKGSTLTAISDKEVKGKIDVKDGKSEAKGEFVAKNCGTMVFAKKD